MAKKYGVAIGINGYQFSFLKPLKYAKDDAALLANFFRKDAQFDEVWLFSDDSPKIADETTTPFRTPLLRFFRKQFHQEFMAAEDSFWLFFSGHGVRYNDTDYIVPIDGDIEDPKQTAISLDWIVERLRRSGAGEIVLIVDICRTEGKKGFDPASASHDGVTTIFSCKANESSWELDAPISQGVFTYALVKNLKKQINGSFSTVAETEVLLQKDVALLNRNHGKPIQTPHIRCESALRANSFLFPPSLARDRGSSEEYSLPSLVSTNKKYALKKRERRNKVIDLKKLALEAEEAKKLDDAKSLWEQILRVDSSEQESYIKAIKRITEVSVLQSFIIQNRQGQTRQSTQLKSTSQYIQKGVSIVHQLNHFPEMQKLQECKEYSYDYGLIESESKIPELICNTTYCLTEEVSGVAIEMVVIPGGIFLMGSSEKRSNASELPKHEVKVNTFLMSKHTVTKQQWKAVARQPQIKQTLKLRTSLRGGKYHPAVEISWHEAVEFCNRLTKVSGHEYRLPTEAEWEYACRAGFMTPFHFGNYLDQKVAQFNSTSAVEVCQFLPNAFGLHDLHGNVWEWCMDHWHTNYVGAPTNGTAWLGSIEDQDRVQRGGSWRNELKLCRSACRISDHAESSADNTGFRIVRSLYAD